MRMAKKKIWRTAWVLLSVAIALVALWLARAVDAFRTVTPHLPGRCRTLPLAASAEDIRVDATRGIAYLSYLDRANRSREIHGTVMLMDLHLADPRIRAALSSDPPGLSPLGMSLYTTSGGPARLFVIDRRRKPPHAVHIFEQTPNGAFTLAATVQSALFANPN